MYHVSESLFLAQLFIISDALGSQLKQFLRLVWPMNHSINMVEGREGNLDHTITAKRCFSWYNWVKHLFTSFFEGLNSAAF